MSVNAQVEEATAIGCGVTVKERYLSIKDCVELPCGCRIDFEGYDEPSVEFFMCGAHRSTVPVPDGELDDYGLRRLREAIQDEVSKPIRAAASFKNVECKQ